MRKLFIFSLFGAVCSIFFVIFVPEKAFAACAPCSSYTSSCYAGPEAGWCSVSGTCASESSGCGAGGENTVITCCCESGEEARNEACGGGGPEPVPTCLHTTCGGGGPQGYGCSSGNDVNCDLRNNLSAYGGTSWEWECKQNAPNCNWDQIPNETVGRCSGHSCTVGGKCTESPADYSCEGGGCTLINTDTTNTCAGACTYPDNNGTCGQPTCANECGGRPNCGAYVPCCSPAAPSQLSLSSPTNGAANQFLTTTMIWNAPASWGQACTGASNTYKFSFGTTNPPPQTNTGLTATSIAKNALNYETTYYWQVIANNGELETASSVWSFTTVYPPFFITTGGNVTSNGGAISDIYLPAGEYISKR